MKKFMDLVIEQYNIPMSTYHQLWEWSIGSLSAFWALVWEYCGIRASQEFKRVLEDDNTTLIDSFPIWFPEARLNFAENILSGWEAVKEKIALISIGEESRNHTELTYGQLFENVHSAALGLRHLGIQTNDVCTAYAANGPEAIIYALGAASIGAIITTIPPDFGPQATVKRLAQTRPKILLASAVVFYNGRKHDQMAKVKEITGAIDSIQHVIIIGGGGELSDEKFIDWRKFISFGEKETDPFYEQLPFNHPLYILYSSGTTDAPKCIVHGAGGTLIQHLKEHKLHLDLHSEDVFLQYTSIGWMMWHWMLSALALKCTLILYDGSPLRPYNTQLLDICARYG